MKKLNVLLLAVAFTVSSVLSASTTPTKADRPANPLSEQISDLLKDPIFEIEDEVMAEVTFMVNDQQEIVVLTVGTENTTVESFIKNRLNYQKVENAQMGTAYEIPVRIVAES